MLNQYEYVVHCLVHLFHNNRINIIFRLVKNMKNQGANDL